MAWESADGRTLAEVYGPTYLGEEFIRLVSYREQLRYVMRTSPATVLYIGKGDGLVPDILERMGVFVTTVDIEEEMAPDVVADVREMPFDAAEFDVSVCAQVLEHLPIDQFVPALSEIRRVTRDRLVVSLPDVRRSYSLRVHSGPISWSRQGDLPRLRAPELTSERLESMGHHWEIGYEGYGIDRIESEIDRAGWNIVEQRRVTDLPWHSFFYMEPSADGTGAV